MQASCCACPRGENVLNQDNIDCFQLLLSNKHSQITLIETVVHVALRTTHSSRVCQHANLTCS